MAADGLRGARALLVRCAAAIGAREASLWPEIVRRETNRGEVATHWRGLLREAPGVSAVRVAHALEMGPPSVQIWRMQWPTVLAEEVSPAYEFAAAIAGFLAGRPQLFTLAAGLTGPVALVDSESCARMAVAGFDLETELRLGNAAQLLASAGDLVDLATSANTGPDGYLILGMKWHASVGD